MVKMGTFGVKRASDGSFCPSTVVYVVQVAVHFVLSHL